MKELPALSRLADAGPLRIAKAPPTLAGSLKPSRSRLFRRGGGGEKSCHFRDAIQAEVPVAAWADASCSWSRDVCVSGGSGPRPAV